MVKKKDRTEKLESPFSVQAHYSLIAVLVKRKACAVFGQGVDTINFYVVVAIHNSLLC
jgi:hypothetical protein